MSRSSPGRGRCRPEALAFLPILAMLVFLPIGAQDPAETEAESATAVQVVPPQIILKTQEPPVYRPAALAGYP